mmetsp:Transcript_119725/g.255482  ORF Transcript_119725/g.255482 Transcript_119725/m.255482 type:complete len:222 (+) Transcript_119725:108-773(+)
MLVSSPAAARAAPKLGPLPPYPCLSPSRFISCAKNSTRSRKWLRRTMRSSPTTAVWRPFASSWRCAWNVAAAGAAPCHPVTVTAVATGTPSATLPRGRGGGERGDQRGEAGPGGEGAGCPDGEVARPATSPLASLPAGATTTVPPHWPRRSETSRHRSGPCALSLSASSPPSPLASLMMRRHAAKSSAAPARPTLGCACLQASPASRRAVRKVTSSSATRP